MRRKCKIHKKCRSPNVVDHCYPFISCYESCDVNRLINDIIIILSVLLALSIPCPVRSVYHHHHMLHLFVCMKCIFAHFSWWFWSSVSNMFSMVENWLRHFTPSNVVLAARCTIVHSPVQDVDFFFLIFSLCKMTEMGDVWRVGPQHSFEWMKENNRTHNNKINVLQIS